MILGAAVLLTERRKLNGTVDLLHVHAKVRKKCTQGVESGVALVRAVCGHSGQTGQSYRVSAPGEKLSRVPLNAAAPSHPAQHTTKPHTLLAQLSDHRLHPDRVLDMRLWHPESAGEMRPAAGRRRLEESPGPCCHEQSVRRRAINERVRVEFAHGTAHTRPAPTWPHTRGETALRRKGAGTVDFDLPCLADPALPLSRR